MHRYWGSMPENTAASISLSGVLWMERFIGDGIQDAVNLTRWDQIIQPLDIKQIGILCYLITMELSEKLTENVLG